MHFIGISGSLRKGSYNTLLLHAANDVLPEGVTMQIVSVGDLPLYNADLDLPAATERPAVVSAFRDALAKADGLVIVSPEYNYSIPGGLKNAIDWASRGTDSPLVGKPIALMGASPGGFGTVRMQLAFMPVFLFLDMKPVYKPEVHVSQAHQKFDANGQLTDAKTRELVQQKLQALKDIVMQTKNSQ